MEQFIVLDKNGPFKVEVSKLGVDTCFFFLSLLEWNIRWTAKQNKISAPKKIL